MECTCYYNNIWRNNQNQVEVWHIALVMGLPTQNMHGAIDCKLKVCVKITLDYPIKPQWDLDIIFFTTQFCKLLGKNDDMSRRYEL